MMMVLLMIIMMTLMLVMMRLLVLVMTMMMMSMIMMMLIMMVMMMMMLSTMMPTILTRSMTIVLLLSPFMAPGLRSLDRGWLWRQLRSFSGNSDEHPPRAQQHLIGVGDAACSCPSLAIPMSTRRGLHSTSD